MANTPNTPNAGDMGDEPFRSWLESLGRSLRWHLSLPSDLQARVRQTFDRFPPSPNFRHVAHQPRETLRAIAEESGDRTRFIEDRRAGYSFGSWLRAGRKTVEWFAGLKPSQQSILQRWWKTGAPAVDLDRQSLGFSPVMAHTLGIDLDSLVPVRMRVRNPEQFIRGMSRVGPATSQPMPGYDPDAHLRAMAKQMAARVAGMAGPDPIARIPSTPFMRVSDADARAYIVKTAEVLLERRPTESEISRALEAFRLSERERWEASERVAALGERRRAIMDALEAQAAAGVSDPAQLLSLVRQYNPGATQADVSALVAMAQKQAATGVPATSPEAVADLTRELEAGVTQPSIDDAIEQSLPAAEIESVHLGRSLGWLDEIMRGEG